MYQELLPLGIDPLVAFNEHQHYLSSIEHDETTLSTNATYKTLVNKPDIAPKTGSLFVSFHFSKHFSCIPIYLLTQVFPEQKLMFVMLKKNREQLPAWKEKVYQCAENALGLIIHYAEEPTTAIKIMRALKKGTNVITFVVANFGSKGNSACGQTVDFLTHPLQVPTGIFKLALKANAPVIQVHANGTNPNVNLCFADPIQLTETNFQKSIQTIYSRFAKVVLSHPSEWSQWGYVYDQTEQAFYTEFENFSSLAEQSFWFQDKQFRFDYADGVLSG